MWRVHRTHDYILSITMLYLCIAVATTAINQPALGTSYGKAIYGVDLPLTYDDVDVVMLGLLPWHDQFWFGPALAPTPKGPQMLWCPRKGGLAHIFNWFPACQAAITRGPTSRRAPSHSWVEISHGTSKVATMKESNGAWFYLTRGSGIFVYTGNTKIYRDHSDAVNDLLNKTCRRSAECTQFYPAMWTEASRRNYSTVQFTDHCDDQCGPNLCLTELIVTNTTGIKSCPASFRTGWNASKPCQCNPSISFANCGKSVPTCHAYIAFGVLCVGMFCLLVFLFWYLCIFRRKSSYTTI